MSLIKKIRNDAIMLVVICAAGYVAYQVLLDDLTDGVEGSTEG